MRHIFNHYTKPPFEKTNTNQFSLLVFSHLFYFSLMSFICQTGSKRKVFNKFPHPFILHTTCLVTIIAQTTVDIKKKSTTVQFLWGRSASINSFVMVSLINLSLDATKQSRRKVVNRFVQPHTHLGAVLPTILITPNLFINQTASSGQPILISG